MDNLVKPIEILLVEDNPGDICLVENAMKEVDENIHLSVVHDGVEAMDYLHKRKSYASASIPDLILLDLNIPQKNGPQVLGEIKNDPNFRQIPVVIFTISTAENDIYQCYNAHANCYITKPFDIESLIHILRSLIHFWFNIVTLPPKRNDQW